LCAGAAAAAAAAAAGDGGGTADIIRTRHGTRHVSSSSYSSPLLHSARQVSVCSQSCLRVKLLWVGGSGPRMYTLRNTTLSDFLRYEIKPVVYRKWWRKKISLKSATDQDVDVAE
jgi:hypothetical protein